VTPLRNLIFDIDGTLLDSRRDIAAAQLWTLRQLGVNRLQSEDIYPLIGCPLAETFAQLLPSDLHARIPEAVIWYRDYYRAHALDTTTLFPGVREGLAALYERGIRLATASTKSSGTSARVLKHFGVAQFFAQIQGNEDGFPFKPDPFILNKIVREQGWNRKETMMVGDTDYDIEAGKRAGVLTCAVTYGSLSRPQLEPFQPDYLADSFSDLLHLF
jgi:phosphoglycolate phosphatase-like HAD superfamily hydrolase